MPIENPVFVLSLFLSSQEFTHLGYLHKQDVPSFPLAVPRGYTHTSPRSPAGPMPGQQARAVLGRFAEEQAGHSENVGEDFCIHQGCANIICNSIDEVTLDIGRHS